MAKIKIIDVPPGEAPLWVRKEWVELELPIAGNAPPPEYSIQRGVKLGKPENIGGYAVETNIAIDILRKSSPKAAQWWKENILDVLMPWLVFKKEVCELIEG